MILNQEAVVELLKSFGRFIYFGLLGLVGAFLTSLLADGSLANSHVVLFDNSYNVGFILVAGIGFIAKAIDRYIHTNPDTNKKGIAPNFLQK